MDKSAEIPQEVLLAMQRFSIIGKSPALIGAIGRAVKVAPVDLSVLIYGPSGAGKEVFPRIIHAYGSRKHKKYIAVNCGAIPEGTIDSELFGHEKGAFTGAVSTRKGYFEEADGGTIFLDEVAELPLTTQARLLRVLETGEFLKVGSSEVQKTNVRIVAATNVDLLKAVDAGKFREDLYYRLSTIRIEVPPLHDRGDDIILLARKFAADFRSRYRTEPITFSDDARRTLLTYNWPGNVRQLKNVVDQLSLYEAGSEISRDQLLELLPTGRRDTAGVPASNGHSYEQDRDIIWQTLMALRAELSDIRAAIGLDNNMPTPKPRHLLPSAKDLISDSNTDNIADDNAGNNPCRAFLPEHLSERNNPGPTTLEEAERQTIIEALKRNNGDKKATAEQLNISSRTLYRKIHDYNINL